MIREAVKRGFRSLGVYLASTYRIGLDVELDLARLAAHNPLKTILDVGGNFGQTALRFAHAFPAAKIFTFEPIPTSFARLANATRSNRRIKGFNIALGDATGSVDMNLTSSAGTNSIKAVNASTGTIQVTVKRGDEVCESNGIDSIDLLKIDVEGYELQVLSGFSKMLNEGRIRFVYAECVFRPNDVYPYTYFFDMHKALDAAGFCFVSYYAESFMLKNGCSHGNVLYALCSKLPAQVHGSVSNIF